MRITSSLHGRVDLATGAVDVAASGPLVRTAEDGATTVHLLDGSHGPVDGPGGHGAAALLEGYRVGGAEALGALPGHYAGVVVDRDRGTVVLLTDPMGLRTLYARERDDELVFASSLPSMRDAADDLTIDRGLEDFFLVHGFHPDGRTVYRDVRKLAPGTTRVVGAATDESLPTVAAPGWPDVEHPGDDATQEEVVELLHDGFMRAVTEQAGDAERVAVLLGGFDSALVAAALHAQGRQVETYTFHFGDDAYDQQHTDTLQEALGHVHHDVPITMDVIREGLRDYADSFNQPTNWANYVVQTAHVARLMAEHGHTVCLSGDGCDSVFLGYPGTHRRAQVMDRVGGLPSWLPETLLGAAHRPGLHRRIGRPYDVGLTVLRSATTPMPERAFLSFRVFDPYGIELIREDAPPQEEEVASIARRLAAPHAGDSPVRLAYNGKSLVSPNKTKMIGAEDVAGVPIHSPFLHPGFAALGKSLPEHLNRPPGDAAGAQREGKYILMRMADESGLLPPVVIHQPKHAAVNAPVDAWYAGPLRGEVREQLRHLPFTTRPAGVEALLDHTRAERLLTEHVLDDTIVSHGTSLLATYAAYARAVG